jgi:hypothetical protein
MLGQAVMLDLFDCEPPSCSRFADDVTDFMHAMQPVIDRIVASLERARFVEDPICGPQYSRINSILSSAQKRHGRILEIAFREGLRGSKENHIWTEPKFAVSLAADTLVNSQSDEASCQSELPYGEVHRTIQIDVGAFNHTHRAIGSYEVKRANGLHDAGKIRSMRRDLACTRVLLRSYGQLRGLYAQQQADARIIFYYGRRSIPAPYSLIGEELDDHFGFAITARIEAANNYYRDRLRELLGRL